MSLFFRSPRRPEPAPPDPFTGQMIRELTADDAQRIDIAVHMIMCTPPTDRALTGWHGWPGRETGGPGEAA